MFFVCVKIICGFCHLRCTLFSRNKIYSFLWKFSSSVICWLDRSLSSFPLLWPEKILCGPLPQECEPRHKPTWDEFYTHLRRRVQSWFLTLLSWFSNVPWFSELFSSNSMYRNPTERRSKIEWSWSIPEMRILWVWDGSRDLHFLDKQLQEFLCQWSENTLKNIAVNCQWILCLNEKEVISVLYH